MKYGRGKVRKAWIIALSFSLLVFLGMDVFALYFALTEPAPARSWRALVVLGLLTFSVFQALRARINTPR